jgi:hypothetical protein
VKPTQSLLPSFENQTLHEIEKLNASVISKLLVEIQPIEDIFNPQKCDAKFLPYLAYANGVDIWNTSFTEQNKRNLIEASRKLHKFKGTIWAMLEVLKALDMSSDEEPAEIKEGLCINYDGKYMYNGIYTHGNTARWREYTITLNKAVSIKKGEAARVLLEQYAPKRSILNNITYKTLNAYDATINYNGEYAHGVIGVVNG